MGFHQLVWGENSSTLSPEGWPVITREQRPWAYWWWMGSAVDKTNLTRELTRYRVAGYGGVHIIPIYGAKGWESSYIRYLSPQWMEMLDHTVREAQRLDLGVDMTTGTGWCFGGGPYVGEREGNATVVVKTFDLLPGAKLTEKFEPKVTQALVAYPKKGSPVELTGRIAADGTVNWTAPAGEWKVYAISQKLSPQKVKRPVPGGEGPMLNLISREAMPVFLRGFTEAFDDYHGLRPRAQYHDSYEYKSEWSPDFFKQFAQRRGYKLQTELPALFCETNEHAARVLADYRETVSDIMVEDTLPQWGKWSHRRGFITRNEAHGSPGNLLDLYALADIPETEMFRLDRNKLISKFASSAAHVAGRKFVAAETGTWLKEHFTETLADMKYLVDDLFISGVNHVFYHGTCYSPDEAGWPGWVFYASFEMNPRNAIWRDARALNDYVARCQSMLQSDQPANDILLYWPIHDYWQQAGAEPLLPHLTVHARAWFESRAIGHTAEQLWQRGYAFDYVSDRQLATAKVSGHQIKVPGGNYRVVIVPPCDFMPLPTLEKLVALAKSGATVIFPGGLPKDVPGLGDLEKRRHRFQALLKEATVSQLGKGRFLFGELEAELARAGVSRESLVDQEGLFYLRRSFDGGRNYFIANRSEKPVNSWVPLATAARSAVLLDAMNGQSGAAALRSSATDASQAEVYLQLQPGESVFVRVSEAPAASVANWPYWQTVNSSTFVQGEWRGEFISGGPTQPPSFVSLMPISWTKLGSEMENFVGTARYSVSFDAPNAAGKLTWLGLGKVNQSARVKLNGKDYGTLILPPFRVLVDNLRPTGNQLEVEVTSTSANAIRYYDREGVVWKKFHDINFVNQDYKPFNAANWPVTECGLLGPVTLTVVRPLHPAEGVK
ncbi:MAG: glycosyl hydrolase [Verrucomicrobiota bacterium]